MKSGAQGAVQGWHMEGQTGRWDSRLGKKPYLPHVLETQGNAHSKAWCPSTKPQAERLSLQTAFEYL